MNGHLMRVVIGLGLLLSCSAVSQAVDLFGVTATPSGGSPITQTASSLPDLIEAVTANQGAFAPLAGGDFTASVTYFGVPNALTLTATGTTALSVTSGLTGLSQSFTGTDRNDLQDQLTTWLLEEGGSEVAKLQKAAAMRSAAALTDGNPASATARMADRAFRTFGLFNAGPPNRGHPRRQTGIWVHGSQYEADTPIGTAEGSEAELDLPWWCSLSHRLSLIGNTNGQYQDVEGTALYGGGADLGLGICLASRGEQSRLGWQVTPFVGLQGIGTYDGGTAGLLDQFGIVNRIEYQLNETMLLVVANQFSFFSSLEVAFDNVSVDPEIEQQILKNGVMLDVPVPGCPLLRMNGFVTDTRFLDDVVIDSYQTVGGGLLLGRGRTTLNAYVSRDFAGDYSGWNAGLGLVCSRR